MGSIKPYPGPVDDCYTVTKYVMTHASEFGGDANRIVLAGDSAGGNAVSVVTQRLLRDKLKMPKLQVLIYPWNQLIDTRLPSAVQYGKTRSLLFKIINKSIYINQHLLECYFG